eukprot:COSAG01_NODE_24007_length_794_cov_0.585612_1_plen_158_part_00
MLLMRSNSAVQRFFLFAASKAEDTAGSSYAIWGDKKPRPAVSAFATCALLTDSPRFETGFRVDAGSRVAALLFRRVGNDEMLAAAHGDTLALWLRGPTSQSPDPTQPVNTCQVATVHLESVNRFVSERSEFNEWIGLRRSCWNNWTRSSLCHVKMRC